MSGDVVTVGGARRGGKRSELARAIADEAARGGHPHVLAAGGAFCAAAEPCSLPQWSQHPDCLLPAATG